MTCVSSLRPSRTCQKVGVTVADGADAFGLLCAVSPRSALLPGLFLLSPEPVTGYLQQRARLTPLQNTRYGIRPMLRGQVDITGSGRNYGIRSVLRNQVGIAGSGRCYGVRPSNGIGLVIYQVGVTGSGRYHGIRPVLRDEVGVAGSGGRLLVIDCTVRLSQEVR